MTTIPGTQLPPDDVQFHDAVTGQWSQLEGPNSDRRRVSFPTVAARSYVIVTQVAGVTRVFPPQAGQVGLQNNSAKDNVNGFPGFFVFQQ